MRYTFIDRSPATGYIDEFDQADMSRVLATGMLSNRKNRNPARIILCCDSATINRSGVVYVSTTPVCSYVMFDRVLGIDIFGDHHTVNSINATLKSLWSEIPIHTGSIGLVQTVDRVTIDVRAGYVLRKATMLDRYFTRVDELEWVVDPPLTEVYVLDNRQSLVAMIRVGTRRPVIQVHRRPDANDRLSLYRADRSGATYRCWPVSGEFTFVIGD